MTFLLFFATGFCLVKIGLSFIAQLLVQARILKPNYRGEQIPAALGLVFPTVLPSLFLLGQGFNYYGLLPGIPLVSFFAFLFFTTGFAMLGLADDLLKNDEEKGFRQHLRLLWQGELTSGGLKALSGFTFSVIFTSGVHLNTGGSWWIFIPAVIVAALAPNIINLFDLRPGRSVKFFLLVVGLLLLYSYSIKGPNPTLYLGAPILGGVLAYFPEDLRGQAMLGDTGANFLGSVFGGLVVLDGDPFFLGITLFLFLGLQLLAEKISFTELIEKNHLLKYIDEWGRD
jgi:UDP-N-acetylmuramyl pentapeptide phosphotransferase/UDP-N-acetylglucosamine-1-phosphate transferase